MNCVAGGGRTWGREGSDCVSDLRMGRDTLRQRDFMGVMSIIGA